MPSPALRTQPALAISVFIYHGCRCSVGRQERVWADCLGMRLAYNLWHQLEGTSRLESDGQATLLRPGELGLTGPGARLVSLPGARVHRLLFDATARAHRAWRKGVFIIPDDDEQPQPPLSRLFGIDIPPVVPASLTPRAAALIDRILGRYWQSDVDHLECCAHLQLWLSALVRVLRPGGTGRRLGGSLADRADRLMRDNLASLSGVGDLARRLEVSRQHLLAVYAAERHCTPSEALLAQRLSEIRRLLMGGALTQDEIARKVGLRSASHLGQVFRRHHGVTPRAWRDEPGLEYGG